MQNLKESSMEPTKTNNRSNENLPSEVDTLLNKLRETGVPAILAMNKKSQMTMSNWAHDFVNQYTNILKNNPMKLKNITELPCSKMDAKLAIKLLLLASVEKGLEDHAVVDLRDKFVGLGSFQFIEGRDIKKLTKYFNNTIKKSKNEDTLFFPELNKYMDLIISEQKALIEEMNSFIEDIRKIKKNTEY
jgi:hypothetical protein